MDILVFLFFKLFIFWAILTVFEVAVIHSMKVSTFKYINVINFRKPSKYLGIYELKIETIYFLFRKEQLCFISTLVIRRINGYFSFFIF